MTDDDGLTVVAKHADAIRDIAASSAPDAYVARILLALGDGREPAQEDLERLVRDDAE